MKGMEEEENGSKQRLINYLFVLLITLYVWHTHALVSFNVSRLSLIRCKIEKNQKHGSWLFQPHFKLLYYKNIIWMTRIITMAQKELIFWKGFFLESNHSHMYYSKNEYWKYNSFKQPPSS